MPVFRSASSTITIFLGNRTVDLAAVPAGFLWQSDRIGQDVDIGLVRLNYRWGGPVIAKY